MNRERRGLSLAELVAVIALAGLVAGTTVATITGQQRFYRDAAETLYARESVRDAMEVLSTDIRAASPADTVRLLADSAIEFFSTIGTSVVCETVASDVGLPPAHASGNSLSAFLTEPDTGDLALFHTESAGGGEHWERYRILSFASRSLASSCSAASRFSQKSDFVAGATGFVVTLSTPLHGDVEPGAPVRFIRRARYSLYRASDGGWYLGYRRCNAIGLSACGVVQPVSGPYRGYNPDPAATGLLFEYFDVAGRHLDPAVPAFALARIDVTARTESQHRVSSGAQSARISDSAKVSVAFATTEETRAGAIGVAREVALNACESAIVLTITDRGVTLPDSIGVAEAISRRVDGPGLRVTVYITRLDSALYSIVAEAAATPPDQGGRRRLGIVAKASVAADHSITIDPISERPWSELF